MADTVQITAGTGTVVGTDEVTIGGTLQHVQRVKLVDGTDGGTELLPGTAARGLRVDPAPTTIRIAQTPTISTTIYASGDVIGTQMTFANAARVSGRGGIIQTAMLLDLDKEDALIELYLYDRSFTTLGSDNAAASFTEADLSNLIGLIVFDNRTTYGPSDYVDINTAASGSSVAIKNNLGIAFVANATDIYGQMVVRGAPTFTATTDLKVVLTILQD